MKILKFTSFILILIVTATVFLGCSFGQNKASSATQTTATVTRGNLTSEITAAGNLALSQTEDLAFEVAGTVEEVSVIAGDSVKAGQVLAKLDTTNWENQITTLERALTAAQRKEVTAKQALVNAQLQATTQPAAKQLALIQAEISLKNAQTALDKATNTYTGPDIETAQAAVDKAKSYLEYAILSRTDTPGTTWDRVVSRAQSDLDAAQKTLNAILTSADSDAVWILKQQLTIAQANYQTAQDAIPQSVKDTETAIENAQATLADAQQSVKDAQKALDDSRGLNAVITAPFDGFVTQVNVKGGDDVLKGTVAVQIADPNKFEAEILVSEVDITKIRVGGEAGVQLSALQGVSLSANVTHISPTATISSGVVNYKVTVDVQPPSASANVSQRTFPSGRNPASGNFTSPFASGQTPLSGNTTSPRMFTPGQRSFTQSATSSLAPANVQLRAGLTATVSIILAQSSNVLLVPNGAVTTQGGQKYVQLATPTGTPEQRAVQIGLSDYQYTEITGGLSEGDKVIVPQAAARTTTQTSQQTQGAIRIPGVPFMGAPTR